MDVRPLLLFFYVIISLEEYIDGTAGACTYTQYDASLKNPQLWPL